MNNNLKLIGAAVVGMIVLYLGMNFVKTTPPVIDPNASSTLGVTPENGQPAEQVAPTGTSAKPGAPTSGGTTKPAPSSGVRFLTPYAEDTWALGSNHLISWNRAAGLVGGVYLVDSAGKQAGWLLPYTNANQTSFFWDVKSVSVERKGGNSRDLAPGRYTLKMTFDGKRADVTGPSFSILAAGQAENAVLPVILKNVSISPKVATVPRGGRVLFINYDAKAHVLTAEPGFTLTVNPSDSYLLNTASLAPNTYYYNSNIYTYQAPGTLIVK